MDESNAKVWMEMIEAKWTTGTLCLGTGVPGRGCGWKKKSWYGEFICPKCGGDIDTFAKIEITRDLTNYRWWNPLTWYLLEWEMKK